MFVVNKIRYGIVVEKYFFKKKSQAKSFVLKNKGGVNLGFTFKIENKPNSNEIKQNREFVSRLTK